ncbi:hydantoinase B/oxoprolinase family protein [Nocardioides endophyticus]|uniref:Hydantoinase B/oxoprolinase family protein n=1 Tax=Nocardioides endophyticus TaxID=1353775 RepID=A0ABP8Z070_9ACTN
MTNPVAVADPLDPVTQEILSSAFVAIAEEMAAVQYRASFSPIIREMEDYSCGLFDADAQMIAHAEAIPAHLGVMQFGLQVALTKFGTLDEGDVLIVNDPYRGGTHTPDVEIFMPIYHQGKLRGYAGSVTHHIDVGGAQSGDSADCTSLFQEGLVLPGVLLVQRGVRNQALFDVIAANVRAPQSTLGDLEAQIAACRRAAERLVELCDHHGGALVANAMSALLNDTRERVVAELSSWPTGEASAVGYLDFDVYDIDTPVRVAVTVRVEDGMLVVDASESSDEVKGSINVPWSSTCCAAYFALRSHLGPDLRMNDGMMQQVRVQAREGSILNPRHPAGVGGRHATAQRFADVLCLAIGQLVPDRAAASSHVSFPTFNFQAKDPYTGRLVMMADVIGGGGGATRQAPGENGVDSYLGNCALLPVEVAELEYPWRIERTELIDGSGGTGNQPGGMGIRRDYKLLTGEAEGPYYIEQSLPINVAQGAQGGHNGKPARVRLQRADGTWEVMPPKGYLRIKQGETISFESAGGGGYGAPAGSQVQD